MPEQRKGGRQEVRVTADDLDNMAKLAGYQGDKKLNVMEQLMNLKEAEGQGRFQNTLQGYLEGIQFLKEHPQSFSDQDLMQALQAGTVRGNGLRALGDLLGTIRFPTPGAPQRDRVEVFVEKLFSK
jgi:hypothetical protein